MMRCNWNSVYSRGVGLLLKILLVFFLFFFSCGEGLCSFCNDLPLHPPTVAPAAPTGSQAAEELGGLGTQ